MPLPTNLDEFQFQPTDLVVIVPSRGRPEAARELAQMFTSTAQANSILVFAVDDDDPDLPGYSDIIRQFYRSALHPRINVCMVDNESHTMVEALNKTARFLAEQRDAPYAMGFMGDDHRPRTLGWDKKYVECLKEPGVGIVYSDDKLQGENLPTQCAMRSSIVKTLGGMAPPTLRHMYVDNFWRDLGQATGCLRYLPDVVIEHMHPIAGKAEWDEGHRRVNDRSVFLADEVAYELYKRSEMQKDAAAVRSLLKGTRPAGFLGAFSRQPETRGAYPAERIEPTPEEHEWRLFPEGTTPEYTTAEWYEGREHAPHIDQPIHRDRLHASATFVAQAAFQSRLHTVVDLGCGDGGLLTLLGPRLKAWGYDLSPENVAAARLRGVDVRYGDALGEGVEWGQIAVATEMLEHLVDPHAFVAKILQHSEALVCSSPWDERPGSAYEFHAWAWDLLGYRQMIEGAGWKVLRQRRVHRFQVILAVRP
jgi:Methionine biosynthesis protein MetW